MPVIRRIKTRLLFTAAGAMALLAVAGCVITWVAVEEVKPSGQGTVVKSPLKAHMMDGSTVVFADGASVGPDVVSGLGQRFALAGGAAATVSTVPLDSVVGMESYETRTNVARTVLASAAMLATTVVATAGLAVAIFGSCPTFYSDSAGTQVLEAEGFSYSIAPLFEQRDVDRLRAGVDSDGVLRLEVRNEALETHYINHLELLQTMHSRDETVVPDEKGIPIALKDPGAAQVARDRAGRDVSFALSSADGELFTTAPVTLARADVRDLLDYIDISVPRPSTGDSVAVILRLRNSLLNTVLLYDGMLSAPGAASLDWLGRDVQKISTAIDLGKWYSRTMGMRIAVRDGGAYRDVVRFTDKGPIAFHDIAVVVPAPEPDSVRVRLSFVSDNWRIDRLAISSSFRRPGVTRVALRTVVGADGVADSAALTSLSNADDRYLVTSPGQRFSARFAVPAADTRSERTFFLVSQGYYTEWVRGSWLKKSTATAKPFVPTDSALAQAIASWRTQQKSLEQRFYSTRIPTR
jgi:hypothetical protein